MMTGMIIRHLGITVVILVMDIRGMAMAYLMGMVLLMVMRPMDMVVVILMAAVMVTPMVQAKRHKPRSPHQIQTTPANNQGKPAYLQVCRFVQL